MFKFLAAIFLYCPYQNVFRCVFHINKFQHLNFVALRLQPFTAKGVGNK